MKFIVVFEGYGRTIVKEFTHESAANDWLVKQILKESRHYPHKKDFKYKIYYGERVNARKGGLK